MAVTLDWVALTAAIAEDRFEFTTSTETASTIVDKTTEVDAAVLEPTGASSAITHNRIYPHAAEDAVIDDDSSDGDFIL